MKEEGEGPWRQRGLSLSGEAGASALLVPRETVSPLSILKPEAHCTVRATRRCACAYCLPSPGGDLLGNVFS